MPIFFADNSRLRINGSGMSPSLNDGDYVFLYRRADQVSLPQRGEVVGFYRGTGRMFAKRIVGLPGETIEIRGAQVLINGRVLYEPYIKYPATYSMQPRTIGPEEYFVLGDGRNDSSDSHNWGNVPANTIIGKVWYIYWPLGRLGNVRVPHYMPTNP